MGTEALLENNNAGGSAFNTAAGASALFHNTTGNWNTATGATALESNTTGSGNTATGAGALELNTTGSENIAVGGGALDFNSTGSNNTATGYAALQSNTTANYNTADGFQAMNANSSGAYNVAIGADALLRNTTGSNNTAVGTYALETNSGSANIAVGYGAGGNLTTGKNNIDIDNPGVAGESGTIRIGSSASQTKTFISGIAATAVTGSAVFVSTSGQLGIKVSSERYKTDIQAMGSRTVRLDQLRPVTFRMKDDPEGAVQYGLIAEEVAQVYPELVVHGEDGSVQGVYYDQLAPMLLNEVQQQRREIANQKAQIADQAQQLREMQQQLAEVGELKELLAGLKVRGGAAQLSTVSLQSPGGL
jgi:hypothetical protein